MEEYKGYYIEEFLGDITVQYCGDDVVFQSVEEARDFIDEITAREERRADRKEMYDRIRDLVADSVADIFQKIQNEVGVFSGDISPDLDFDLEKAEDSLTEVILKAIDSQF